MQSQRISKREGGSYNTLFAVAIFMVTVALYGCSKTDTDLPYDSNLVEITSKIALIEGSGEAYTRSSDQLILYFARADQLNQTDFDKYQPSPFTAIINPINSSSNLTFTPTQFYLQNGLSTKLTGWHPIADSYDGEAVNWIFDGSQDIITSSSRQGSKTSSMPEFNFNHALTQIQFHPFALPGTITDKILKIEVLSQPNKATYTLTNDHTGEVTFSGDATFSSKIDALGVDIPILSLIDKDKSTQVGSPIMMAPQNSITLRITTRNLGEKTTTITQEFKAGVVYKIFLNCTPLDI